LATVIHFVSGKAIPISYTFFIANVFLLGLGFYILGKSFGVKTVYGVIFSFVMLAILPEPELITHSFREEDKLICAIIGGILGGFGIAITFQHGGSAGGTDIIAMIVNKYKNMSPGKVYLYTDLLIIGSSFFINWDIRTIVYGYVTMGVFSYSVDLLLSGSKQSVQITIISPKYQEIANKINEEAHRGVTAMHSIGWYSKAESMVLIVMTRKRDMKQIHQIVNQIDKDAFLSESSVMGVYGRGFDTMKGI
jgi:uncharacterized membrane-anchored protein YitT (DUF2179 family)